MRTKRELPMQCPSCRQPMIILEFREVELDYCPACEGCWLDTGELGLILRGKKDVPEDWNVTAEKKTKRRCPRCNGRMREGLLPGTNVEVDVCVKQHGLWLDEGELQAIAAARANEKNAAALAEFCASVFGKKAAEQR